MDVLYTGRVRKGVQVIRVVQGAKRTDFTWSVSRWRIIDADTCRQALLYIGWHIKGARITRV